MRDSDFIDSSGFLRVQEKRLITASGFERIADAPDLEDAFRMLSQNSDYDFASLHRVEECEAKLRGELQRVYTLARSLTPDQRLVDVLACRYDYHNIKAAVKAKFCPQRTALPYIYVGTLTETQLEKLPETDELPEHLAEAIETVIAEYEKTGNPQDIDIAADRAMFAHMLTLCGEMDEEFITGYVRMMIDFANIKTLVRVREMQKGTAFLADALIEGGETPHSFFLENYARTPTAMVPVFYYRYFGDAMRVGVESYERSGNFSALEKLLDNLLLRHLQQVKYLAFGAPILFAYILNKENEIRQVRILLTCKNNGISPELLKERLRESYA